MTHLSFNDPPHWLGKHLNGIKKSYLVPKGVKKGVCVDVGANVGAFAITHHQLFNRVICIEPALETSQKCARNTKKCKNVEVHRFAAGKDDDSILRLRKYRRDLTRSMGEDSPANFSGNASTFDSDLYSDNEHEEVPSISFPGLFSKFNLEEISYLKIDCEGAEYDFLMDHDLSKVEYLGIEIHRHLFDKIKPLIQHIEKYFTLIKKRGNGIKTHMENTYRRK